MKDIGNKLFFRKKITCFHKNFTRPFSEPPLILSVCEETGMSSLITNKTTISSKILNDNNFEGGLSGGLYYQSRINCQLLAKKKKKSTVLIGWRYFFRYEFMKKIKCGASAVRFTQLCVSWSETNRENGNRVVDPKSDIYESITKLLDPLVNPEEQRI